MMILINRIGDNISGAYNGIPFGVAYSEEKWNAMKELEAKANSVETMEELKPILDEFAMLTQESYKELVETACPWVYVNKATNKFYLQLKPADGTGDAVVSSQPLPKAFVDRILTSVDKKIDVMPLVKAFIRFLRNPNYSADKARRFAEYINAKHTNTTLQTDLMNKGLSDEVARERATTTQVAVTQEGLIACYKVSQEVDWKYELDEDENKVKKSRYKPTIDDVTGLVTYATPEHVEDRIFQPAVQGTSGDEFFCGDKLGHIIKVGQVHYLPKWDQVNTNDSQSCVKGLHVGNQDYIRGYQNEGTVTHYVFIDPMHIGAIVNGHDGAMRVKQYFVYASFAGTNKGIYHSSKYGELTDEEYRTMLQEAIQATGELKDEAEVKLGEKKALI